MSHKQHYREWVVIDGKKYDLQIMFYALQRMKSMSTKDIDHIVEIMLQAQKNKSKYTPPAQRIKDSIRYIYKNMVASKKIKDYLDITMIGYFKFSAAFVGLKESPFNHYSGNKWGNEKPNAKLSPKKLKKHKQVTIEPNQFGLEIIKCSGKSWKEDYYEQNPIRKTGKELKSKCTDSRGFYIPGSDYEMITGIAPTKRGLEVRDDQGGGIEPMSLPIEHFPIKIGMGF